MAETKFTTDRDLVTGILRGEEVAAREFVRQFGPIIYGAVRRFPLSPADRDEVFQGLILRLLDNNCRVLRAWNEQNLPAYLKTISRNLAIDLIRKRGLIPTVPPEGESDDDFDPPDQGPTPEQQAYVSELKRMLQDALNRLTADDRRVIQMCYLQEMTYAQIAESLHGTIDAIGVKILRAKRRLKEIICDEFPALVAPMGVNCNAS